MCVEVKLKIVLEKISQLVVVTATYIYYTSIHLATTVELMYVVSMPFAEQNAHMLKLPLGMLLTHEWTLESRLYYY